MIRKLDLEDTETLRQILELQLASYKVEAEMIGFYDIPPLKDTMDSLKECGEIFYGYYAGNVLAGIISYKVDENVLDIHRVAIHPNFFRMGIADKLVRFIESIEKNIMEITVCT